MKAKYFMKAGDLVRKDPRFANNAGYNETSLFILERSENAIKLLCTRTGEIFAGVVCFYEVMSES